MNLNNLNLNKCIQFISIKTCGLGDVRDKDRVFRALNDVDM